MIMEQKSNTYIEYFNMEYGGDTAVHWHCTEPF